MNQQDATVVLCMLSQFQQVSSNTEELHYDNYNQNHNFECVAKTEFDVEDRCPIIE